MKTKFFKKLSFVLVVAMVLSLLVPAAGAFAAAAPKLNSTKKYLHLGRDDANEFNFNINNKQKGWQYYWESDNEEVVEVNEKNGVVNAVGVGKAKVTVYITDADDEEVDELTATVTVRDNIEEVTIKNPVEGTLAVGAEHDFNRSYVTESGSTKKTSGITRWIVDPAEGASIDDKGVFVATEAGEYTVTAVSFQSKAKYDDWLDDPETYKDYVTAESEPSKVVVAGSILEAKQVELDKVDVYFDSAVEDADKNLSIYQMVGTTPVKQLVKEVKLSDDKKVATVTMYIPFTAGATYTVDYTGMDSVSFVAATAKAEDVASMQITTSTAKINEPKTIEFKLFNAAGVDITTTDLKNRVTMKSSNGLGTFFNSTTKAVTIFNKDATTTITATYHTYKYDNMGNEIGAIEAAGVVVGVEHDATNVTGLSAWTIVDDNDPDFDDVQQILAVGDNGYQLFVEFATLTGSDEGTVDSKATPLDFNFTSSDKNVLIIDQFGNLYPVKEGTVVVVVSYGANAASTKTPIGAVSLTVSPKRFAGSFTLSSNSVQLTNTPNFVDDVEVELTVKDNLGVDYPYGTYKVEKLEGSPTGANTDLTAVGSGLSGKIKFVGSAAGVAKVAGVYYYRVTVAEKIAVITVTVLDGDDDLTATNYKVELSATTVDLKAEDTEEAKDITIQLVGRNASGIVVSRETLDGVNFDIEIEAPESEWNYNVDGVDGADAVFAANKYTLSKAVSPNAIEKAPTGSYKVTGLVAKDHDNDSNTPDVLVPVDIVYFSVTDTQPAPVLAEVKTRLYTQTVDVDDVDNAGLLAAVKGALKITLGGTDVTANIVEVEAVGTADEFNIVSVKVKETFTNGHIIHKVNIGLTVTKN